MSNENIETVETSTELVPTSNLDSVMENLAKGNSSVRSTFVGDDFATKLEVYSAVAAATPLEDVIDKTIELSNWVMQPIELTDQNTGEVTIAPRIILVDASGAAYACVSGGVLRSLESIAGILGLPHTWPMPLPIVVKRVKAKGAGHFFTIEPAKVSKSK